MSNIKLQGNASGTGTTTLQSGNTNSNLTLALPIADGTANQALVTDGAGVLSFASTGSGDVVGPSSSVDSELALFNSTTGKLIKRASLTGLVKATSGVASAATAGTDYVAPAGALGTPSSGTLTNCTADGTDAVGFRNVPIASKSAAYTTVLADSGKVIFHPSTDANARTFTIDSNANVVYPLGTVLTFINMTSQVVTIAITSDTMYLAGTGTTGSRTLAQYGMASAIKMTSTTWIISGSGLT
tara:strand:+ start:121 stop:849 length:729 start_codon:yes stop_codon:yes gene_type:complete